MDKHHPALVLVTDLHMIAGARGRGGVRGVVDGVARGRRLGHPRPTAVILLVRAARHICGFSQNTSVFNSIMGDFYFMFH